MVGRAVTTDSGHHRDARELEAGLGDILRSPRDEGPLELLVRRPGPGLREVLEEAQLTPERGLDGDDWWARGVRRKPDRGPNPDEQLTLMNARLVQLLAGPRERWALAGDQLYVDLDLSEANLPAGSRLAVGPVELEVTALPHTGCGQFAARFGTEALKFVNGPAHRPLRLRGVNARVVRGGTVRQGDLVRVLRSR